MDSEVCSMMISTRPSWLLPYVCALAVVGAAVVAALAVCFFMAVVTGVNKRAGGAK